MPSVTGEPGRGGSSPARRELNQHMHHKHPGEVVVGTTLQRLVEHEELHRLRHWDHTHEDYELPGSWHRALKDG